MPTHVAGSPALEALAPLEMSSTAVPSTASPAIQPTRNAGPLARARGVASISTTPMIGTGLMATPTANGRLCPIACPMAGTLHEAGVRANHPAKVIGGGATSFADGIAAPILGLPGAALTHAG